MIEMDEEVARAFQESTAVPSKCLIILNFNLF